MLCLFTLLVTGGPNNCRHGYYQRKQAGLMLDTEVVLCHNRMVHALFPPPPFCKNKQYGEGEMSQAVVFVYFISFFSHLLFFLRKYVEHDQPLLHF